MINNLILMDGYGVYVWSSFLLTFIVCVIVYYKTRKTLKKYEKEFAKEIEELILKEKNKNYLLFINSPNNPSGQICENLEEIAEVANKYNLIILSDEIYSELSFEKNYKYQFIMLLLYADNAGTARL